MNRWHCQNLLVFLMGCSVSFDVPGDALLECTTDAQCPTGWSCRLQHCAEDGGNAAPTVSIAPIARSVDDISVSVTVVDLEANPVTLTLTLIEPDGTEHQAGTALVSSSPEGTNALLPIDGLAVLGDALYRPNLVLAVLPADATSSGNSVRSLEFAFGNAVPTIRDLTVDLINDEVSGLVLVHFLGSDSSADDMELASFKVWRGADPTNVTELDLVNQSAAHFPAGGITNLNTLSTGATPYTFVWASNNALPTDEMDLFIGLSVRDLFGESEVISFGPFTVNNATSPPVLSALSTPSAVESGAIAFGYTLTDADGDGCIVLVEYSQDGVDWSLAASETSIIGVEPGEHVFVWESTQLGLDIYPDVRLRFTVTDGLYTAAPVVTAVFDVDNTAVGSNSRPVAILQPVVPTSGGRFTTSVALSFTLFDEESHSVAVTAQYAVAPSAEGDWRAISLVGDQDPSLCGTANLCFASDLASVPASPTGVSYTLLWDALHNAGLDNGDALFTHSVLVGGVGTTILEIADDVFLRVSLTDLPMSPTTPAVGLTAQTQAFVIGNQPPTPEFSGLSAALSGTEVSGPLPVELTLTDASRDLTDVELTYTTDGGATYYPATIAQGRLTELTTAPSGTTHVVVWDSALDLGPTVEPSVSLRLVAKDYPNNVAAHESDAVQVGPFLVRNNFPPGLVTLAVGHQGGARTGRIPISYALSDEEGDVAAVLFEYRVAPTDVWRPCTEFPDPRSEGISNLATAPHASTSKVKQHTFVWDSSADVVKKSGAAEVRATVRDAEAVGATTLVLPSSPLGPPSVAPNADPVEMLQTTLTLNRPKRLIFVDLNQDGALDVVSTGRPTSIPKEVYVQTSLQDLSGGRATGTFAPAVTWALGAEATNSEAFLLHLVVADLDEDGIYDVAVAQQDGEVGVALGGGVGAWDGTFGAPAVHDFGGAVVGMAAVDVNGDGVLDLVGVSTNQSTVVSLLGGGTDGAETGAFSAGGVALNLPSPAAAIVVSDVDQDGVADILLPTNGLHLSVSWGPAAGAYAAPVSVGCGSASHVMSADVNGDGFVDLVCSQGVTTTVVKGGVAGDRRAFEVISTSTHPTFSNLQLADINADGALDLLGAAAAAYERPWFALGDVYNGVPDGGFAKGVSQLIAREGDRLAELFVVDIDGNGRQDLVGHTGYSNAAMLLALDAFGGAPVPSAESAAPYAQFNTGCASVSLMEVADLNHDGALDALLYCGTSLTVAYGALNGVMPMGTFNTPVALWQPASGSISWDGVRVADMNGDDIHDILLWHQDSGTLPPNRIYYLPGLLGAQGYAVGTPVVVGSFASGNAGMLVVSEVTGDGIADVVATPILSNDNPMDFRVVIFAGDGAGLFTPTQLPLTAAWAGERLLPAVADINGDGYGDIMVAAPNTYTVQAYLSDGAGGFATPVESTGVGSYPQFCDVDQDGIPDAIGRLGVPSYDRMLSYGVGTGFGDGTFDGAAAALLYPTGTEYISINACADLNDDGLTDLVGMGERETELRVVVSQGLRAMSSEVLVNLGDPVWGMHAGDMNGDGLVDAIANTRPTLTIATTRAEAFGRPWTFVPNVGTGVRALGTQVVQSQLLDFGDLGAFAQPEAVVVRFHHGPKDGVSERGSVHDVVSFKDELRFGLALPPSLTPISAVVRVDGFERFKKVPSSQLGGADTDYRLAVEPRFGPSDGMGGRAGLGLAGPFATQRGFMVPLRPLVGRALPNANKVRVFQRVINYRRASEIPEDPGHLQPNASRFLPRVPGPSASYQDLLVPVYSYIELPRVTEVVPGLPDLSADSGPRFYVTANEVVAIVDEAGVLQAFATP